MLPFATWIAGLELDVGWADNGNTTNPVPGTANTTVTAILPPVGTMKENWDGSVRGRLGFLTAPDTLVFAAGGLALQQVELSANCAGCGTTAFCLTPQSESYEKTMSGWTVGGGVRTQSLGRLARPRRVSLCRFRGLRTTNFPAVLLPRGDCDQRFTAHFGLAYKF